MLNDPRISSNMHWEFEKKINIGGERVFNEMYTAQRFKEIAKHCPAGCFPLAVILYQDETWLTKSGSSADKPLVMSFGNLNQETYVQAGPKLSIMCVVNDNPERCMFKTCINPTKK